MSSTASPECLSLELTGPLERLVGADVITLPVTAQGRLGEVLAALVERFPQASEHLGSAEELRRSEGPLPPGFLVIRDAAAVPARLETAVTAGERLTLLCVISGG